MVSITAVDEFLAQRRFAVVGASDDKGNFARTIYRELRSHGYDVVPVNPSATTVEGDRCYPDLASVPGEIDGAIVMVRSHISASIVRGCADRGITRVWLFKGIGGTGAVSDEAVRTAHELGLSVIEGACPLMFLGSPSWIHRVHRFVRRRNGALIDDRHASAA